MSNSDKTTEAWNESGQGERVQSMGWKEMYLKDGFEKSVKR